MTGKIAREWERLNWLDRIGAMTEVDLLRVLRSDPEFVELIDGNWALRETVERDPVRFERRRDGKWAEREISQAVH
jgi:hypothetical protein